MSDNAESSTPSLVAPGEYTAKATNWAFGQTKNQKVQFGVDFLITQKGPYLNWHLTKYFYFEGGAFDNTIKALRAMGWTGDAIEELNKMGGELDKNEVRIVVDHESYEGKISARIQWVNEAGGVRMAAPMSDQDVLAFSADMKKKIKISDAKRNADRKASTNGSNPNPPSKAPEPPAQLQPPNDDDIPF
jgi:hypothetical protein